MSGMFLDPKTPLHTCSSESCEGCDVATKLVCHYNIKQLLLFFVLAIPVFLSEGYLTYQFNLFVFIGWIVFIMAFFGLIEIRVMCSHCPHYAEPDLTSLKCWANYGSPKLWKYRPGPMSLMETIIFYSGFVIILVVPIILGLLQALYIISAVAFAILILWKIMLKKYYCSRCINFACPLNNTQSSAKTAFFNKNPIVKKAYEESK